MMETITIELTAGELSALKQLIHFATQARGMEVAEAAVVLCKKLDEAARTGRERGNGNDYLRDSVDGQPSTHQ